MTNSSSSLLDPSSLLSLPNPPASCAPTIAKRPRSFWDIVLTATAATRPTDQPSHLPTPTLSLHHIINSSDRPPKTSLISSPVSDFGGGSPSASPLAISSSSIPSVSAQQVISLDTQYEPAPSSGTRPALPPSRTIAKLNSGSNDMHTVNSLLLRHSRALLNNPSINALNINSNTCDQEPLAHLPHSGDASVDHVNCKEQQDEDCVSRPHVCDTCGSTFARSSHLRLHIRTIHYKLKPFQCGECGASFGHVSSKYRHFRTVHLKRRDFSCDRCGQTFAERSAVLKHCRTVHEGSRPYPCPTCGFRFHFKLHLAQHVATVHDKLRPHQCPVCNARFGQRSSLNRHARQIHGGGGAAGQVGRPKRVSGGAKGHGVDVNNGGKVDIVGMGSSVGMDGKPAMQMLVSVGGDSAKSEDGHGLEQRYQGRVGVGTQGCSGDGQSTGDKEIGERWPG